MKKTKIDWCDSTFNPVTGCYHGCDYCYARCVANRFKGCVESPDGTTNEKVVYLTEQLAKITERGNFTKAAYPYGFTPTFHEYRLSDISGGGYGKNVFVCSMADLFGKWVPTEWILKVFEALEKAPDKRYLFLTKNPERYLDLAEICKLPKHDNWWYGTTVTKPEEPYFFAEGYNTFVSVEPIKEKFTLDSINDAFRSVKWVIFGAETGNSSKKTVPNKTWIEEAVEWLQSKNIPVFMKDSLSEIRGIEMLRQFPW